MGSYICHVASRQCPAGFKYDSTQRKCLGKSHWNFNLPLTKRSENFPQTWTSAPRKSTVAWILRSAWTPSALTSASLPTDNSTKTIAVKDLSSTWPSAHALVIFALQNWIFNPKINYFSDFDECALGLDTCNRETEVCRNVYGGFNCTTRWTSRRPPLMTTAWATPTRPTPVRPTAPAPAPTCQPGFKHDPNTRRCIGVF